ncbi:MAG: ABC transporter permease [Flavobacteriales bacterium]|nr:ABC transporter permease [Flavobacteriales bacterium]
MNTLRFGYQICKRTWKKLYYRPIHLVFSFVQPIFWLTIFGFLFERSFQFPEGSYLAYLLPGVCAMTVIQSSSQAGILFIKDFQTGFFGRYNFTPASRFSFLFFKIFADFSRIFVQVVLLFIIGWCMGIEGISISFKGLLLSTAGIFMFTYFYAALSSFIAIRMKVSELMATFINLFNLPIIFTSTALVPNKGLPSWLETIAQYNPLSHLSQIIRGNTINADFGQNAGGTESYIILAVLMLISFGGCFLYLKKVNYQ